MCSYYEVLATGDPGERGYVGLTIPLAAPELIEQITASAWPTFFGRPLGSYSNVRLETISETADKAIVTSYFELERMLEERTFQGPVGETFGLEKLNGEWLVASFEQLEPEAVEVLVQDEEGNSQSVAPGYLAATKRADHGARG